MPDAKFYEDMLFNNETSNRTEYRDGEIKPVLKTVYTTKPSCHRIRPPHLSNIHTLVNWQDARVPPFNLFHKPKDVVRTNPWVGQKPYEKPKDTDLEKAIKTRPRLVMTPAVSLDNIPPKERKLLIEQMYTSTAQRQARGVLETLTPAVRAPLPNLQAPAKPFVLQKLVPPYVSPEWRLQSAAWDGRQLRACCNPDREFYLARKTHCAACEFTAAQEANMKLEKQITMKGH